jgi:hypothetical protein
MTTPRLAIAAVALVLFSGCYHATINTEVQPVAPKVTEWKHAWLYGLVPPSAVDAKEICRERRVARIETKQSLANGLVTVLTAAIYSPMEVTVTCGEAVSGAAKSGTGMESAADSAAVQLPADHRRN